MMTVMRAFSEQKPLDRDTLYVRERGRTNEYTFNFGGNVSNVVYFGIGLGIMDLDYEMTSSHDENLSNTSGFVPIYEEEEW